MTPGGWGEPEPLVISKYSKNPEAAYLLIQWMSSKEVQKKWIEGPGSGLPLRTSSMNLPFATPTWTGTDGGRWTEDGGFGTEDCPASHEAGRRTEQPFPSPSGRGLG